MSYVFNPFTGEIVPKGSVSGGGGSITEAEQAKRLIVTRRAQGVISAMKLVCPFDETHIKYATSDAQFEDAEVLGLSLNSGNNNDEIQVLLMGLQEDASFNFTINKQLFLGINGSITEVTPTSGNYLVIGRSLGGTAIFIERKQVITL